MAYDVDTTDIICLSPPPYDGPFGAKKGDEDDSDIDTEIFFDF